jgi:tRNA 2-thiouridine synthesizing protein A
MSPTEVDRELDVCGYNCPIPLLRLKKELAQMAAGEVVRVYATDPGSKIDFLVYMDATGHQMIHQEENPDRFTFVIRKKS